MIDSRNWRGVEGHADPEERLGEVGVNRPWPLPLGFVGLAGTSAKGKGVEAPVAGSRTERAYERIAAAADGDEAVELSGRAGARHSGNWRSVKPGRRFLESIANLHQGSELGKKRAQRDGGSHTGALLVPTVAPWFVLGLFLTILSGWALGTWAGWWWLVKGTR
jgi:hypothetical protein